MPTQTRSKSEREKLRKEHPDSWIAVEAGDEILGKVVDVTEAWSDQRNNGSFYPLLTIDVMEATGYDNEPDELKVHCFGAVLYNEIMRHEPEIGETVRITYKGTGEAKRKGYNAPELYSVRVEGRTDGAQRAYGRIRQGDSQGQPMPKSDIPAQTSTDDSGDDIPF